MIRSARRSRQSRRALVVAALSSLALVAFLAQASSGAYSGPVPSGNPAVVSTLAPAQNAQLSLALAQARPGASQPVQVDPLVQQGVQLRGKEEIGGGLLGFSVALSADGNTALVGGPRDNGFAGAVWVFTRSGGEWTQQGPKLTTGEPGSGAECAEQGGEEADECSVGRSVALSADGNTAAVGSPREPGPCRLATECRNQGAAWLFTRSGPTWSLQTKLTGGEEEGAEGRFGHSVALSGDGATALVGAPSDRSAPGAAWVFTRSESGWSQQGPKLTASDEVGEGHLGGSAALSADGNTALLGGPGDNGYTGAAWMFTRTGSSWTQAGGKLTGEGEEGQGRFGFSVAVSSDGTTALIGARTDGGAEDPRAGAAWAFTLSGSSWSPQGGKLTAGAATTPEAEFGYSVALSSDGGLALIGAPRDEAGLGAAWLLARSSGGWTEQGPKLTGPAIRKGWFGTSVALRGDGTTALIGAPNDEGRAGTVWLFADPSILPAPAAVAPDAGPEAGGTTVTITGSRLAGASAVRFGSARAASFTDNADGSITAVSPPRPEALSLEEREGKVRVTVTTPEGPSPAAGPVFTYLSSPKVTAVTPAEGPTAGAVQVTITGSHVGDRTQSVTFGAVPAAGFTVNSSSSVTAIAPPEPPGVVHLTVTTPGGVSEPRSADRFTFVGSASAGQPSGPGAGAGAGGAQGGVLGFTSGCSAALLSRSLPVLSHARASVKLRWRGTVTCRGKLRLAVKVKRGRRVTVKTIATGTFTLLPGRTRTLLLKLNAAGRTMFKAHHQRLSASLLIVSIASGRTQARTAGVRLTPPPKPRHARPQKHTPPHG
ncbi:MAG TPA: IPT/TIG domain-containing protein [Solirubrobacteraceae bacterium]